MCKHEIKIDEESRRALKEIGIVMEQPEVKPRIEDLSFGIDCRGDEAFFIESFHINGWGIDSDAKEALRGKALEFFRVLENGSEVHSHGWIENGKIVQWG